MLSILWTVIVGAIVGTIAKFVMPGKNEPNGFIMTAILGIVGSLLAGYAGQAIGWYSAGQGAGWIGSIVGAVVVFHEAIWVGGTCPDQVDVGAGVVQAAIFDLALGQEQQHVGVADEAVAVGSPARSPVAHLGELSLL